MKKKKLFSNTMKSNILTELTITEQSRVIGGESETGPNQVYVRPVVTPPPPANSVGVGVGIKF